MPATDFFDHPTERFLCPVETCCRTFKSKTPWTRHLRTAHANLNLHHHEHTIVNLRDVSLFPIQGNRDLRSSSPGVLPAGHSPVQSNADADDFPLPDAPQDYPSPLPSASGSEPPDNRSLPNLDSQFESESFNGSDSNTPDYHPIISGNFHLFLLWCIYNELAIGEPCDQEGNPLLDPEAPPPVPEPRNPDDWTPFESDLAFRLAEFLYKDDQTSAAKTDQFLQLMAASLATHGDTPPFVNHRELYETIDAIPVGGVPWQSFTFTYEGPKPADDPPKWMDAEYVVWYRDPHELFLEMLKNPEFAKSFDAAPLRQYNENGDRQYENFMSGDWAWKQAVRIFLPLYNYSAF